MPHATPPPASDTPPALDRVRYLGHAPGRYIIEKYTCAQERRVSAFACRIQRISPVSLTLAAPVAGEQGDWITTYFRDFGMLRGRIARRFGFGFTLDLHVEPEAREALAARVAWAERYRNYEVNDHRRHQRVLPRSPQSSLMLEDGTRMACFVIDMSPSGAAISAALAPAAGAVLAVGTTVGRVVRQLEVGFAIQFVRPVPFVTLEERLIRPLEDEVHLL